MRRCASPVTRTRPASRRTRRCLDVDGWLRPSASTSSPTARGCSSSNSRRARRLGPVKADQIASGTARVCRTGNMFVKVYTDQSGWRSAPATVAGLFCQVRRLLDDLRIRLDDGAGYSADAWKLSLHLLAAPPKVAERVDPEIGQQPPEPVVEVACR